MSRLFLLILMIRFLHLMRTCHRHKQPLKKRPTVGGARVLWAQQVRKDYGLGPVGYLRSGSRSFSIDNNRWRCRHHPSSFRHGPVTFSLKLVDVNAPGAKTQNQKIPYEKTRNLIGRDKPILKRPRLAIANSSNDLMHDAIHGE